MTDPRKFKAPYNPKERIWQEADRLRAAHPAGRELPVKILDLAEFDLHLDLVPVNGLREFCLENGYDPSNWSKIEREVLPPPRDEDTLRTWAKQLGLKQGSDDWLKFFDYAAVDSGRIPDYVLKDEKLVAQLPVFFRTLSGDKPSGEELENLIKLLREP